MPLDHYVTLGRSGLRVSPLCLGAMTFGEDLGWGLSVEESQQIIDRCTEFGGNFIDTANFYTKSHSEKIIGDYIGHDPARHDRLVNAAGVLSGVTSQQVVGQVQGLPRRHGPEHHHQRGLPAPTRTSCTSCARPTSCCGRVASGLGGLTAPTF